MKVRLVSCFMTLSDRGASVSVTRSLCRSVFLEHLDSMSNVKMCVRCEYRGIGEILQYQEHVAYVRKPRATRTLRSHDKYVL